MGNTSSSPSGRALNKSLSGIQIYKDPQNPSYDNKLNTLGQGKPLKTIFGVNDPSIITTTTKSGRIPLVGSNGQVVGFADLTKGQTKYKYEFYGNPVGVKINDNGKTVAYSGYFKVAGAQDSYDRAIAVQKSLQTKNKDAAKPESANPSEWNWNLPPHAWSMPVTPRTMMPDSMPDGYAALPLNEMYRRGRIWWRANDPNGQILGADKSVTVPDASNARKYGFQFLWNPESFGTQVAIQMDATPTAADRFLAVAGAFPATETISFTIRIDRTNDFAWGASKLKRPDQVSQIPALSPVPPSSAEYISPGNYVSRADVQDILRTGNPYSGGTFFGNPGINGNGTDYVVDKLTDLFNRGTIADIEYIYRAVNGNGPSGAASDAWVNSRGIATADIGFLMPTLLNIDIGPLSYQGYINNLTVTHTSFTENMIPIRSDVTMSINLLATAGISSNYAHSNSTTGTTQ